MVNKFLGTKGYPNCEDCGNIAEVSYYKIQEHFFCRSCMDKRDKERGLSHWNYSYIDWSNEAKRNITLGLVAIE